MDRIIDRIKIPLRQSEYSALLDMAVEELRQPEQQLLWLLREEMRRRGVEIREDGQPGQGAKGHK